MRAMVLILAMAVPAVAGVKQYDPETWFEQDPTPIPIGEGRSSKSEYRIPVDSIGNPLDYAGARIGLDVRNVELPRGWEGGYRYCCRFDVIDLVASRPLFMKQWAESISSLVVDGQRSAGPAGVAPTAIGILAWDDLWRRPHSPSDTSVWVFVEQHLGAWLSPEHLRAFAALYDALEKADGRLRWDKRGLTGKDSAFFRANPGYYLAPDGKRLADLTGNTEDQLGFIARARRFPCYEPVTRFGGIATAVRTYVADVQRLGPSGLLRPGAKADTIITFDSPIGTIVVSGFGNDTLRTDAAVELDLGGDDVYSNNAGATSFDRPVSVCLDLAGNDRYDAQTSSYVQGFGFMGVGMLVDLAGNDVYEAKHFSQGAGIMGVGVLWDKAGNDSFSAHAFCQGAGMFGLGMTLDDSGDDVFDCASNGQGSATTLGLGILSDLAGNDKYRLACDSTKDAMGGLAGYGQGGALSFRAYPWEKKLVAYGGVGMLVDDKGNDDYVSKGWNCQGGSYIMSLGVLVDNEGNDHYDCGTGQGSGIHVTNAILIDRKGDDMYEGGFRAGGSGSDRSPGFLIDYEGNDTYKSSTSSYGTACKPFAYSLFIDYQGDDKYICEKPKGPVLMNDWHSFGGVWPESDPNAWPYAICLDLGGNDGYQVRNRANNSETHSFGHGIFLDMEWKGGDVIGNVSPPFPGFRMTLAPPQREEAYMYELEGGNLGRFGAVGRILAEDWKKRDVVLHLLRLRSGGNRDYMECIHHWIQRGPTGGKVSLNVPSLLSSNDPEVRTIVADDIGLWNISNAEGALIEVAEKDSSAQVRRFALRSLIRLESAKALPLAWRLAGNDTSEDVRRMAVSLIGKVRPSGEVLPLLANVLENDKASSVRCAAADAIGNIGEPAGIEPLRKAVRDMTEAAKTGTVPRAERSEGLSPVFAGYTDFYLLRACGKALCALYQIEGIDLLIKSMSFPSIDAFYNYDRNVPNYISTYAGFDLPDSERYVQAKWQAWFDTHRDSINIKFNADAYKAWTTLSDSLRDLPDSAQIARYEAFLKHFPSYDRARKELAGKLNGIAWSLATAPKGSRGSSPKLALKHALRAVELSDDPNIWDTAIEAYLANGMKADALRACKEALARHPNEQMLKDRLAQLERK
ncbi:hypothetical protein FJY68_06995 [candidate division WOR-3 bacterium]|uniref:HEAT repeat domain-containing protein n=1 Tax=candidate division WOR-3 bacterium TaxID=2052148 RepID=A0A937XIA8_UNCW3|nr:hypothetical protein [candidate division WOR-3 bacterium]